ARPFLNSPFSIRRRLRVPQLLPKIVDAAVSARAAGLIHLAVRINRRLRDMADLDQPRDQTLQGGKLGGARPALVEIADQGDADAVLIVMLEVDPPAAGKRQLKPRMRPMKLPAPS